MWGYLALGYTVEQLHEAFPHPQNDPAEEGNPAFMNWFLQGMEHHGGRLCDPPRISWDLAYRDRTDLMILLAHRSKNALTTAVKEFSKGVAKFGKVVWVERGEVHKRPGRTPDDKGMPVEHFGFADSISQPKYFVPESDREWAPPLSVLCPDSLADKPNAFGSYLVFRKLEQNVKGFHADLAELATKVGLAKDLELAGAMVVGRFSDGTPLVASKAPLGPTDANDFAFEGGSKCPFHAHIRKVRPRGDLQTQARMVRRGVSYGDYDPVNSKGERPSKDVGLLFMSFQSNIQEQFGFVQTRWANNSKFPVDEVLPVNGAPGRSITGPDPLIGQGRSSAEQQWPIGWGEAETKPYRFGNHVTLKGGEFFFAPSKPFFEKLAGEGQEKPKRAKRK